MKRYVLDADSLRAFLEDRPGATMIEDLLWKAVQSQEALYVSVISWNYLFSNVWRCKGEIVAREKMKQLEQLPIEIVNVGEGESAAAARLSATYEIDYLNCLAAGIAQQRRATLVTTNKLFAKLGETIKVLLVE